VIIIVEHKYKYIYLQVNVRVKVFVSISQDDGMKHALKNITLATVTHAQVSAQQQPKTRSLTVSTF
jgi:hypothetical protein